MFPKYDFIVSTCIYNRTNSLKTYMESLLTLRNRTDKKFHIYFTLNFDELWPKHQAISDIEYALSNVDWQSLGLTHREGKEYYDILPTPNIGLSGYNLGLEIGKILNNTPVFICNDDIIWPKNFTKLLDIPTKAIREGKEVTIRPETIGAMAPMYIGAGSMKHQEYDMTKTGCTNYDFCVGHCTLITKEALKKDFRFENECCTGFGPYDVYLSQWMCAHELNTIVNHEVCFTFKDNKESHFHEGKPEKFNARLGDCWEKMAKYLREVYQPTHIKKWGFNKWNFD